MTAQSPRLWTEEEVAKYLRVSLATMRRLRKAGQFPGNHALKVGRRYLYPPGPELVAMNRPGEGTDERGTEEE